MHSGGYVQMLVLGLSRSRSTSSTKLLVQLREVLRAATSGALLLCRRPILRATSLAQQAVHSVVSRKALRRTHSQRY